MLWGINSQTGSKLKVRWVGIHGNSHEGTTSFATKPRHDTKWTDEMNSSMKNRPKLCGRVSLICAGLLFAFSLAAAQVASHSSTTAEAGASSHFSTKPVLQPVGRPVARVNGAVLTDRDLLREMFNIFPYARQHNGFPRAMEADIRAGAMKMMIFEELVYQQAKRSNMTIPPEQVTRGMAAFRKQFNSPAEYRQFVKEEFHGSQQLLQTKVERSLLIDKYLRLKVADRSTVSLAEAKAYFDKNPERFRIVESFAFQSITILPPQNATASQLKEERKHAEDALKQAKSTKNYDEFGLLAEKISEDDFRVMMGDHKAADRSKLPPAVVNALAAMQPNQVSDLIEFDKNAYTILRLNAHISPGTMKFEDVKDSLRAQMQKNKTEELRRDLDARLRKTAKVEEL
jgi:PPIC-type PPIASE domain/SurA N-terminal domain